jgi:hypothetical protein
MEWQNMEVFGRVIGSRIILTRVEVNVLSKAEALLVRIRQQLEAAYGVDEAAEMPAAEPWIYAECYLSEVTSRMGRCGIVVMPPREEKP